MANATAGGCGGAVCTAEEYCWNSTKVPFNTTECIPLTFSCGGMECENNPQTVCNLDRGACMSLGDICEGVRSVEANCADETVFSRWTLDAKKDGIRTLKVPAICNYEPGKCGEPVPVESTPTDSSANKQQQFTTYLWGATTMLMMAMMGI